MGEREVSEGRRERGREEGVREGVSKGRRERGRERGSE